MPEKKNTKAYQLSLFYYDVTPDHLNIVDLYGEIPKYVHDKKAVKNGQLQSIQRNFTVDGEQYSLVLHPAKIEQFDKAGNLVKTIEVFPGTQEELVEDAIMKIAIRKQNLLIHRDTARVPFTLYELSQELSENGHTYSWKEIKQSLLVLNRSVLAIYNRRENKKPLWSTSTYPELLLSSDAAEDTQGFVQLHSLVVENIVKGLYRQIDYSLSMNLTSTYARRIYKQLAVKFTWASPSKLYNPYQISLVPFLEKHSFKRYGRITDNAKLFRTALDLLEKKGVIFSYEEEPVKDGRKTIDIEFFIRPTKSFSDTVKRSLGIKKEIKGKLKQIDNVSKLDSL